ncbi:TnsA-like heteromeric transposase endonuclease subunit [Microbacterium paludicola]|uniref:TnsA-like heteromeric transposase endonuclease subunit n=1 Tax=Microbacterium paludicola TaxID=300019 RepID=A0A4Y9FU35_9MICO|nr:TnsA-like heteromeric transposase endonuclease subunit [Microbacterium paludicola]MBF0816875.1 TnsA-like heteromeric transposase endonuclease subunit [Microbacterium paludicola]TFU32396.1 TnsA-like heteromeric transposase endonuclease subunit [Microbacterium paludicola]
MTRTAAWLDAIDQTNALDATLEYSRRGVPRHVTPTEMADARLEEGDPVRHFVTWPGKRNFEGRLWLASTRQHVPFESFWERAFLASLDRAGSARAVASQPLWIRWRDPRRAHVPDYFVRRADGQAVLVDVRPRDLIEPEDAVKFELTRRLASALGWEYLLFDALPGATQANLRFLLRYRDPAWLDGVAEDKLPKEGAMSLAEFARLLGASTRSGIGAAYAMIWARRVHVDLTRPLSMATRIHFGDES